MIVYLDFINDADFMLSATAGAANSFLLVTSGRVSYDVPAHYISIFMDNLVSCNGHMLGSTPRGFEGHQESLGK